MSTIVKMLDSYAEFMTQAQCLEDQIKTTVPALWNDREAALKAAETLKDEIKGKAKFIAPSNAHTLIGKLFQLVWKPGRAALDEDKVIALIDRLNALTNESSTLDSVKSENPGWWEVRKVGKKK